MSYVTLAIWDVNRYFALAMGQLKLRGFSAIESARLGELIARARQGALSTPEGRELTDLMSRAEQVSRANAKKLSALRDDAPVPAKKHGRSYPKSS